MKALIALHSVLGGSGRVRRSSLCAASCSCALVTSSVQAHRLIRDPTFLSLRQTVADSEPELGGMFAASAPSCLARPPAAQAQKTSALKTRRLMAAAGPGRAFAMTLPVVEGAQGLRMVTPPLAKPRPATTFNVARARVPSAFLMLAAASPNRLQEFDSASRNYLVNSAWFSL